MSNQNHYDHVVMEKVTRVSFLGSDVEIKIRAGRRGRLNWTEGETSRRPFIHKENG